MVAGVTGNVGSEVAGALIETGVRVRALVREPGAAVPDGPAVPRRAWALLSPR